MFAYTTREQEIALGAFSLRLLTVDRLEDLVDSDSLLRDEIIDEPPYWAHLWTGSRVLAELVATEADCAGKRVADLGCGLGLAGLAAAKRGARVLLCDYVEEAVRLARASALRNGLAADGAVIDLRTPGLRGHFDLCLAADITYDPVLQIALAAFLAAYLTPGGECWCVESVRTTDRGFPQACRAQGLRVTESDRQAVDEGKPVAVRLTRVQRPLE